MKSKIKEQLSQVRINTVLVRRLKAKAARSGIPMRDLLNKVIELGLKALGSSK